MSREPMPVPLLYRILFLLDWIACGLYAYILGYLLKEQGKSLFTLEWSPERVESFLVAGIIFFGLIGNLQMLRGKIRALFFCYINWFLGLGFFLTGFFSSGLVFPAFPKAIPSYIIPQEWLAGDIFMQGLSIRVGFAGLYLVALLRTTSVYSYFSKIQKEQAEKDKSGKSIGSFRKVQPIDIPDTPYSPTPLLHQETENFSSAKPDASALPKKRGFFRKLFSAFIILLLLAVASGIGFVFLAPETFKKLYQEAQARLPWLQQTIQSIMNNIQNSPGNYGQRLENKIAFYVSKDKPITLSQAVEEICILAKVPYLMREMKGTESLIGAIVLPDAKASSILEILLSSRHLQYALCPKGLYLKKETEITVDWNALHPTAKTSNFK